MSKKWKKRENWDTPKPQAPQNPPPQQGMTSIEDALEFMRANAQTLSVLASEGNPLAQAALILLVELLESRGVKDSVPGVSVTTEGAAVQCAALMKKNETRRVGLILPDPTNSKALALVTLVPSDKLNFTLHELEIALQASEFHVISLSKVKLFTEAQLTDYVMVVNGNYRTQLDRAANALATSFVHKAGEKVYPAVFGATLICHVSLIEAALLYDHAGNG